MSWSRRVFAAFVALGVTAALGGCGFTPVYAPGTAASKLEDRLHIQAPSTRESFLITQQLETRLGRGGETAPMTLAYSVSTARNALGATATGGSTRLHHTGTVTFQLKATGSGAALSSGTVKAFTGYSATGNTVATFAAERDASERLMVMLADRVVDRLHALDPATLP